MDFMETMMQKASPSMREHLEASRKRFEECQKRVPEYCKELGIECTEQTLNDCREVENAIENKRACESCQFTVDTCEDCKFTTWRSKYAKGIPQCAKYIALLRQKEIARIMGDSGLGERFKQRRFETFTPSEKTQAAYNTCIRFCETFTPKATGLLLIGSYGCGKTHLAAAIIRRMAEKGVAGVFVVVPELLAKVRASFGKGEESAEEIIRVAKEAQLLVLDDLGAENATDWVLEQLFLIINHRYEHMLPTIITTNCNGRELEKHIGQRTLSRIAEMTDPIQIKAADYRMRKFA